MLFSNTATLPDSVRAELAGETVVFEQVLKLVITWRDFRAPRRRYGVKKELTRGTLLISRRRLLIWANRSRQVDITYDAPLFDVLELSTEPGKLVVISDVGRFHDDWSGHMEFRIRHPEPEWLL